MLAGKATLTSIQPSRRNFSASSQRLVSSSPYGRTHVWRRRPPRLPNPVVPIFPQRVILSDGSTYTHWTTSPRSSIRLTRDTTSSPLWNPWLEATDAETDGGTTGRMGRFRRRFEGMGNAGIDLDFMEDATKADMDTNQFQTEASSEKSDVKKE